MNRIYQAEGERIIAEARQQAYDASYAISFAEGARIERARIGTIMGCPEAVGRQQAAIALATESSLTADEAVKVLAGLPETPSAQASKSMRQPDTVAIVSSDAELPRGAHSDHDRGREISKGLRRQ